VYALHAYTSNRAPTLGMGADFEFCPDIFLPGGQKGG
jgi:hypothetical protein